MRISFALISIILSLLTAQSQDSLFTNIEGIKYKDKIVLSGNGYEIKIVRKKIKKGLSKTLGSGNPIDEIRYDLSKWYINHEFFRTERDDMTIFDQTGRYRNDSVFKTQTIYVYPLESNWYEGISFMKKGKINTAFQDEFVEYVRANGIPECVFSPSENAVTFSGEKIPVNAAEKNDPDSFYVVGPGKIRNRRNEISWNFFDTCKEARENLEYTIADYIKHFSDEILEDAKDTLIFRNKPVEARRINTQYFKKFGKYGIMTAYFFNTDVDGKHLSMDIRIDNDTVLNNTLPHSIEKYFIQTESYKPYTFAFDANYISPGDTVFIEQKTKWPVWTYHNRNTRINGLSVGLISGTLSEKNVTTNGIELDAIGTSIAIVFNFPYLLFSLPDVIDNMKGEGYKDETELRLAGEAIELEYKNRMMITNGLKISTLGSFSENATANGIAIGGLVHTMYKANGISIAGLMNMHYAINGAQISGIVSSSGVTKGLQIGGIYAYSGRLAGMQVGLINSVSFRASGLQIGAFNRAGEIRGLQIGIFNSTKILKGIQLGLWNKNKRRSLPIINWGF